MVESSRLRKKGAAGTLVLIVVISIVLGLLTLRVFYTVGGEPLKESSELLRLEAEERISDVEVETELDKLLYEGRPYDKCGNKRGKSFQDEKFSLIRENNDSADNPFIQIKYPEFYECTTQDCCAGFVYKHILDIGSPVEDMFVYFDFYITKRFEVDAQDKNCTNDDTFCCPSGTAFIAGSKTPEKALCGYAVPTECELIFYHSVTGEEQAWKKFYQTNETLSHTIRGRRERWILPIGEKFKLIKVLSPTGCFISYINAEVIPWDFNNERYLDICTDYYPKKYSNSLNFLYDDDGEKFDNLTDLESAGGYILDLDKEGITYGNPAEWKT